MTLFLYLLKILSGVGTEITLFNYEENKDRLILLQLIIKRILNNSEAKNLLFISFL